MWIVIIAVAVFCLALTVPCLVLSDFVSKNKNKGLKRINAFKYQTFFFDNIQDFPNPQLYNAFYTSFALSTFKLD